MNMVKAAGDDERAMVMNLFSPSEMKRLWGRMATARKSAPSQVLCYMHDLFVVKFKCYSKVALNIHVQVCFFAFYMQYNKLA